ncbi:hypothetical protein GCM10023238_11130 [Streptomyces heliomycini]
MVAGHNTVVIGHDRDCAMTTGVKQQIGDRCPAFGRVLSRARVILMIPAHIVDEQPLTYADSFDVPVLFRKRTLEQAQEAVAHGEA